MHECRLMIVIMIMMVVAMIVVLVPMSMFVSRSVHPRMPFVSMMTVVVVTMSMTMTVTVIRTWLRMAVLVRTFGILFVLVGMSVTVMIVSRVQQCHAGQVHNEPDNRHGKRLHKVDRVRMHQVLDRLNDHSDGDNAECQCAGEPRECPNLASTETESSMVGVPARHPICSACQTQRADVGRHMPTVGQESHRVGRVAHDDLDAHHRRSQDDDALYTALLLLRNRCSSCSARIGFFKVCGHAALAYEAKKNASSFISMLNDVHGSKIPWKQWLRYSESRMFRHHLKRH
jgi:hypothetical protein